MTINLTLFEKANGALLSKDIGVDGNGGLNIDAGHCWMTKGTAYPQACADLGALCPIIAEMLSSQALGLGQLKTKPLNGGGIPVVT